MLTLQLQLSNFIFQSEKIRWGQSIQSFEAQEKTLCGDVLLMAAFVSYVGSFTKQYRQELVDCKWVPFLQRKVSSAPYLVSIWKHHVEISVVKTVHIYQVLLYLCSSNCLGILVGRRCSLCVAVFLILMMAKQRDEKYEN